MSGLQTDPVHDLVTLRDVERVVNKEIGQIKKEETNKVSKREVVGQIGRRMKKGKFRFEVDLETDLGKEKNYLITTKKKKKANLWTNLNHSKSISNHLKMIFCLSLKALLLNI